MSVRAIWREEDEEWGVEELKRVEGGVIEDEENGSLGVGILVSSKLPRFALLWWKEKRECSWKNKLS